MKQRRGFDWNVLWPLRQWLSLLLPSRTSDSGQALGQRSEELAAGFLTRQGYQILDRNYRSQAGEVDIVARQGGTLVLVEVKSGELSEEYPPQVRVGRAKQRRLVRLAEEVMKKRRLAGVSVRIDVVEVVLDQEGQVAQINHYAGAVTDQRAP